MLKHEQAKEALFTGMDRIEFQRMKKIVDHSNEQRKVEPYIEVFTLAIAWIYFETLIQKKIIRKNTRRVYLATCIFIAFKQVQIYGDRSEYTQYLLS